MTKRDIAHYNEFDRLRSFFGTYANQLGTIPFFAVAKAMFDHNFSDFENYISKQSVNLRPLASEKKIYKRIMAFSIIKYADRGCFQATMLTQPIIAMSLDFSVSYIAKTPDKVALVRATLLRDILDDNRPTLTEITQDIIDEIDEKLSNFSEVLTKPTAKIKERKSEGTMAIPPAIKLLTDNKKVFTKMINSYFPALNAAWKEASKVGKTLGSRRMSFLYRFLDSIADLPISKVKVILTNGNITIEKLSSRKGYVRIFSMEMGTYNLTAGHPSYQSISFDNIPIIDKTIAKATIHLTKIAPPSQ